MPDERIEYLERRVVFLEATLAKLMAFVLYSERENAGKSKVKDQAASLGSRRVVRGSLDAALVDLLERVELSPSEEMAMPDPGVLRRRTAE